MFDFSNVIDASKLRQRARLSLVALALGSALACEHRSERVSGEGSLAFVSTGRSHTGAPFRTRGTITVRGLNDGALHYVPTSNEAGTRELRLAPGLYSVALASDFDVEWLEQDPRAELRSLPIAPVPLVARPEVVQVSSGTASVVHIRFESHDRAANALAAHGSGQLRATLGFQNVSGSSAEPLLVCRSTGAGCESSGAADVPSPERRLLERYSR
jgi:hypothetical protein